MDVSEHPHHGREGPHVPEPTESERHEPEPIEPADAPLEPGGPMPAYEPVYEILVVEEDSPEEEPTLGIGTILSVATIAAVAGSALTVLVLWLGGVFDREPPRVETIVQQPTAVAASTGTQSDVVAAVAEAVIPSIVTVQQFDGFSDPPSGSGSGVVYRSDGFILTNDHVIAGAAEIRVIFSDGLTYAAELVGSDPVMDIAVLRVDADGLPPVALGSLAQAKIGDPAIAVGNPLGLDGGPSVTSGVISAFDRTLATNGFGGSNDLYGLLQTDAPITRGSSGGALVNRQGELIGITTAIGISDVGAEGLGFAVPVDLVVGIADDLIATGEVRHAFLGIQGRSAFVERADGSELPLGAEIRELLDDSAIGRAGAQAGDVIVALDGDPVSSMILLVARLREYRAGEMVTVTVDRGGEAVDLELVLDQR